MNNSNICQVTERDIAPSHYTTLPNPHNMDAIAHGVRARFEENTGYERRVTDATIKVAQTMGIPEHEIEKWTSQRLTSMNDNRESLREIKRIMERLYGNNPVI